MRSVVSLILCIFLFSFSAHARPFNRRPKNTAPPQQTPAAATIAPKPSAPSSSGALNARPSVPPKANQVPTPAPATPKQATAGVDAQFMAQLNAVIEQASVPILTHGVDSPWAIVHGILALKDKLKVRTNTGYFLALDWLKSGADYRGLSIFENTMFGARGRNYRSDIFGFEGHPHQFFGYLATIGLPGDFTFNEKLRSGAVTMNQLAQDAKKSVGINPTPGTIYEATYILLGLPQYIDIDETWTNARGETWDIERILDFETQGAIEADFTSNSIDKRTPASCHGSHRLWAISNAVMAYKNKHPGKQLHTTWWRADQRVIEYLRRAQSWQNPDGSFSSNWFASAGYAPVGQRLPANGHTFEWLAMTLSVEGLKSQWMKRGALSVMADLQFALANLGRPQENTFHGAFYHALHGLIEYRDRLAQQQLVTSHKP